LVTQSEKI